MAKYAITYTTHVVCRGQHSPSSSSIRKESPPEYDLHIYIVNKELEERKSDPKME